MKNYLFVINQAPYRGSNLQELFDVILITAAFEQGVSLLLIDDGVFSLKKNQKMTKSYHKDTAAIFKVLEIYDIHHLYVEVESLQQRGLKLTDLLLPVQALYRKDMGLLFNQQQIVVNQ